MSKFKYENILLTGAAGALGNELREMLSQECKILRVSDKLKLDKNFFNEEVFKADLSKEDEMLEFRAFLIE